MGNLKKVCFERVLSAHFPDENRHFLFLLPICMNEIMSIFFFSFSFPRYTKFSSDFSRKVDMSWRINCSLKNGFGLYGGYCARIYN